jgi:hypothetical protein
MFLRLLKVDIRFYYLFAEICYGFQAPGNPKSCVDCGFLAASNLQRSGFPGSFVPRNCEPAWIPRPDVPKPGFQASMIPEPTVEFAFLGSQEPEPDTSNRVWV